LNRRAGGAVHRLRLFRSVFAAGISRQLAVTSRTTATAPTPTTARAASFIACGVIAFVACVIGAFGPMVFVCRDRRIVGSRFAIGSRHAGGAIGRHIPCRRSRRRVRGGNGFVRLRCLARLLGAAAAFTGAAPTATFTSGTA